MRQIVLTSFSQDTNLVSKTATAYLKFNDGELIIPISQEALTEVVQFMTETKPSSYQFTPQEYDEEYPKMVAETSEVPQLDARALLNKYRNMDQLNAPPPPSAKSENEVPYRNPFEGPNVFHHQSYDEDTGGVVMDEDGFSQF